MVVLRSLFVPVAIVYVAALVGFSGFEADDAYIVARYAENFVDTGSLVFNLGERVCALTSPLHAIIEALLYALTGATLASYKILSLSLVLFSVGLMLWHFSRCIYAQLVVATVVLLSPCVVLWTLGGMETPLLLCLATLLSIAVSRSRRFGFGWLCFVSVVAGLCFVTRYDSVLFTAPLVLYAGVKSGSTRKVAMAAALGAALPVCWILFSWIYYGDFLPTSFYVKTPRLGAVRILQNADYLLKYLTAIGCIPLLLFLLLESRPRLLFFVVLRRRIRESWGLYLGVLLMLGYGLSVAQTHMMFSFRYFVPFIPASAMLLGDLFASRTSGLRETPAEPRFATRFAALSIALLLFQAYQMVRTHQYSLNGIVTTGEYHATGTKSYETGMMATRKTLAAVIRRHWEGLDKARPPRIYTTAGGMLPYNYKEAYFLESGVSYRRHCRFDTSRFADYVHFISPRHGSVEARLFRPVDHYELVVSLAVVYDGNLENFMVFYDPDPDENRLPSRVNEACK